MPHRARIEELIAKTTDPVQQATLIVLSNFDLALDANTKATEAIAKDLTGHRQEFVKFQSTVSEHMSTDRDMLSSIRAGWWVGLMFLSVVNIVGGWIITRAINSNDEQDRSIRDLQMQVRSLESELKYLHPGAKLPEPTR